MEDRFEEILRSALPFAAPDEELSEDVKLRDLGLDSLGMVQLLAALEQEYRIRFLDDALSMETFETPGVLWKTVADMIEPVAD